jgi:hypothetical protein
MTVTPRRRQPTGLVHRSSVERKIERKAVDDASGMLLLLLLLLNVYLYSHHCKNGDSERGSKHAEKFWQVARLRVHLGSLVRHFA